MLLITLLVPTQHVHLSCDRQGCILGKNLEDGLESDEEGMSEAVGVNYFTASYVLLPIDQAKLKNELEAIMEVAHRCSRNIV